MPRWLLSVERKKSSPTDLLHKLAAAAVCTLGTTVIVASWLVTDPKELVTKQLKRPELVSCRLVRVRDALVALLRVLVALSRHWERNGAGPLAETVSVK